jgi:hypothetical protein
VREGIEVGGEERVGEKVGFPLVGFCVGLSLGFCVGLVLVGFWVGFLLVGFWVGFTLVGVREGLDVGLILVGV